MSEGSLAFNPDFDPDGNEGGVDTNLLPWLPLSGVTAFSIKPLRASMESGMFSIIIRLEQGASLERLLCLSGMDMLVLSGALTYSDSSAETKLSRAFGVISLLIRAWSICTRVRTPSCWSIVMGRLRC